MSVTNIQSEKTAKKLFLLGKYKKNNDKPLISLRGIVKGVRFSEKQIRASRFSLFKKHR